MKAIKQFSLISILFIFIFSLSAASYAESDPTFETLAATSVTDNSVYLHGDFYSDNDEQFPIIWFQYGIDPDNFNNKTGEIVEIKKDYISSQFVSNLNPETKYYFRTVLEINSSIYYGDILSFVTLSFNGNNENIGNVDYGNGGSNEALDKMLQEYDSTMSKEYSSGSSSENNVSDGGGDGSYSFFDFFKWLGRNKDEDKGTQSNLVHSEEEIRLMEEEKERRLENLSEQERYNNSALEDDEFGEIVKYNTNYNNKVKSTTKSRTPIFIFVVLLIAVVIVSFRMFLLKKKKHYKHRSNLLDVENRLGTKESKYSIPVKRDLHDPKQNPNLVSKQDDSETTFFRRPPKK